MIEEIDEEMECPCPCAECGKWCDQSDMWSSNNKPKWNSLLCDKCHQAEEEYEERMDEIGNILNEISDAEWTIQNGNSRLAEMKVTEEEKKEAKERY